MRRLLTFVLLLSLLFSSLTSFAQDPDRIPPELEKYRKERVGPLSNRPPDPADEARMQKIMEHKRKVEALRELRRTGQTTLTPTEIEDFLDASGLKRGVKFDIVPVCRPGMPVLPCGAENVWMVLLVPHVKIADVDTTIETLESKYGVQKHPEFLVDYDRPTGAYFVVIGNESQARALSRDPLVRMVVRSRAGFVVELGDKKKPSKAPEESRAEDCPQDIQPAVHSLPLRQD
ncbi:MAG: hypothetical protein ACREBD_10370 [Blastocatellia bacterium]